MTTEEREKLETVVRSRTAPYRSVQRARVVLLADEVKVGMRGLCTDLAGGPADSIEHEVFIQVGSCYYYTEGRLFIGATHPFVLVRPAIPLAYGSRAWDFGWARARTDGYTALLLVDPYSLKFRRLQRRYSIRWFVR